MSFILPESSLLPGLCLFFPSLVKKFLHFTKAPLALVHPNVFRILMGCSVLNFLYQLDISLVEICFIYTLKLGIGGYLPTAPSYNLYPGSQTPLRSKRKGLFWLKVCGTRHRALHCFSLTKTSLSRSQVCFSLVGLILSYIVCVFYMPLIFGILHILTCSSSLEFL